MKGLRWLIGRRMTHTTWLLAARVSDLAAEGLRLCAICFVGARVSDVAPLQRDCGVPGTGTGLLGGGRESSRLALPGGLGISAGRLPPHCAPKFWFMAARVVPRGSQCWRLGDSTSEHTRSKAKGPKPIESRARYFRLRG